jgi:hypothetical protein
MVARVGLGGEISSSEVCCRAALASSKVRVPRVTKKDFVLYSMAPPCGGGTAALGLRHTQALENGPSQTGR